MTGVQTCALPIWLILSPLFRTSPTDFVGQGRGGFVGIPYITHAFCRTGSVHRPRFLSWPIPYLAHGFCRERSVLHPRFLAAPSRTSPTPKIAAEGRAPGFDFVAGLRTSPTTKTDPIRKRGPVDKSGERLGICQRAPYIAHRIPYIAHDIPYIAHDTPYIAHIAIPQAHVIEGEFGLIPL